MNGGATKVVQLWQQLKKQCTLTKRDLGHVIVSVPSVRDEAVEMFLEKDPSSEELANLLKFIKTPELRNRIWVILKQRSDIEEVLDTIVHHAPEFAEEAGNILLQGDCSVIQLLTVFTKVPSLKEAAWQKLLEQELRDWDLIDVLRRAKGSCFDQALEMLQNRNLDKNALERAMVCLLGKSKKTARKLLESQRPNEEAVREALLEAMVGGSQDEKYRLVEWCSREFFRWNPTNDDLSAMLAFGIISSREWERAAKLLMERQPENHHLLKILSFSRYLPNLVQEAVNRLLAQNPSSGEMADAISYLLSDNLGKANDYLALNVLEKFVVSGPTAGNLMYLLRSAPELGPRLEEKLLDMNLTDDELFTVWTDFAFSPALREKAQRLFFKRELPVDQLVKAMRYRSSLAYELWDRLMQLEPSYQDLDQLSKADWLPSDLRLKAAQAFDLFWVKYRAIEAMSELGGGGDKLLS